MISTSSNRVRKSLMSRHALTCAVVVVCLAVASPNAYAQSTWLPTSGTFSWLTSGSWSNSSVPNATGATAVFPTGGVTVSIPNATITTGTIRTTNASGNVVIGDTTTTTDILNLDVATGTPTIDVGTGGQLYMYANVTGSQGFTKTGAGILAFRYNPHDMAYTGTVVLNQGTLIANQDGSLGNTSNPISVTGNSTLQLQSGSSTGVTLNAGRTTTINSGVTWNLQNGVGTASSVANQVIAGSGNLNLVSGTFTLNGNNTYAGTTTLTNVNRLTLGSGAKLSSAGLTLTTATNQTFGTVVDLGGNSQSVSSLAITTATNRYTTTFTNGSLSVTGGNLAFNSGVASATSGTQTYSLDGLSSFTYSNPAGTFAATISATANQTSQTVLNLASAAGSGTNTITALSVNIGSSGTNVGTPSTVVGLGKFNTVNAGTMQIGYYQGTGTMSFQSGVTNGSLVLRGVAGGSTAMDLLNVGYQNSGSRSGQGTLNLANGSFDARVNTLNVGFSLQPLNNTSLLAMGSGTVVAGTICLGGGNNQSNATFTQSLGDVTATSLLFGGTAASGTPHYSLAYNLNGGTLRAGMIATNVGTFSSTTSRTIAWTAGTVANYDATTDLTINGTAGAGGTLTFSLGGAGTKTLAADTGRTITIGANALVSSTGSLTVNGAGTVVINGSNSYSGGTMLAAGTLRAGNANAFGSGGVTVASGATLDLNSLAVGTAIANNGGTVTNASAYAGTQTLSGASAIGDLGGTLVVANGGAATFGGALAAATTINAGGNGTLNDAGSITAASLTNNGTFTIDRTGSSSISVGFNGNGTLVKAGAGVVTLSGSSSFSGATQVNAGDLRVNGSLAGGVSVASIGILGGSGIVGAISGAGMVGPGNSPGILGSTGALDPTGGLDFSFEFGGATPTWSSATASVNDVLHLTAATPMTAALGSGNTVNVYLNVGALTAGNTFLGGIFIDKTQAEFDLASYVSGATFAYFVAGGSDVTYNGVGYSTLANYMTANPGVTGITPGTATVASADFATGTVTNGQAMQFAIVPEPGAMVLVATGALAAGWTAVRRLRRR